MAKRTLEMKRQAREEREARKARAAEDRDDFRRETNSCPMCGTRLEPYVITVVENGNKVELYMCPTCRGDA